MKVNKNKEILLSADDLKQILDYDPETGFFTRKYRKGRYYHHAGKQIGSKHHTGYLTVGIGKHSYLLHRLAWLWMTGKWPQHQIDHINAMRSDNRWINLREATHKQNAQYRKVGRNNTSGYVGVSFFKQTAKYSSSIRVNGKRAHLGFFANAVDAAACRNIHATYLGLSSRLNIITKWPHYAEENVS